MSGILVPFLPMTTFDFSFLAASGSKSIVIHPGLNVVGYYYARMIIRVHQIDIEATGSRTIKVSAYGASPSKDDSQEFVLDTSTLEVTLNKNTQVGISKGTSTTDIDTDMFPFLKIVVTGTYDTAAARMFAVLSGDLLLREA
jgi:hypothetical protein